MILKYDVGSKNMCREQLPFLDNAIKWHKIIKHLVPDMHLLIVHHELHL